MKVIGVILLLAFSTIQIRCAVLAQSDTSTLLVLSTRNMTATKAANNWGYGISQAPSAIWIWDSSAGATSSCNMSIRIVDNFSIVCLNQPLKMYVAADNFFTAKLNGVVGTGNQWQKLYSFNVPTTNVSCGQVLTLDINASNEGSNCAGNPAGLLYGIISPDCPCATGSFYESSVCGCSLCTKYLTACASCTSSTVCTSCANNSYVLSSSKCSLCNTFLANCATCSSSSVCLSCSSGYVLSSGTCVTCSSAMAQCLTCTSRTSCLTCATGFAPNSTGCSACSSLLTGCITCSSNLYCTVCDTANNFVATYPNCSCATGYVLNGGSCKLCSTFLTACTACSSSTVCSGCSSGYTLNGSTCALCSAFLTGCTACSSKTACTSCNSTALFTLKSGVCACQDGYALSGTTCTACSNSLTGCTVCSSTSACTACNSSYALNASVCKVCATFLTACLTCTSTTTCTGCSGNNHVLNSGQCKTCATFLVGCLNCSSATVCSVCDTANNFVLDAATNVCVCGTGYAFNNSACSVCSTFLTGCTTCTSTTACTGCVDTGYALKNAVCSKCATFMPGCLNCTSDSVCSVCNTTGNFELSSSVCSCVANFTLYNRACVRCSTFLSSCVTCTSTTACTSCVSGFVINQNTCQTCASVLVGCLTCTSTSVCTSCDTSATGNFALGSNSCVCKDGFALNITVCRTCDTFIVGCTNCSSKSACTTCLTSGNFVQNGSVCSCAEGFTLSGTSCQSCPGLISGCLTCSSRTICQSCDTNGNFRLDSGLCLCQDAYYFNGTACPACDATCLTCRGTATNCTSCKNGAFLENNQCKQCPVGCLNCTSALNCSQCADSFTLNDTVCQCNAGTYLDTAVNVCKACHPTCYACSGPQSTNCTACVELQFRLLQNSECVCNSTNYKESVAIYPVCEIINTKWCREVEVWDDIAKQCVEKCGDGRLYSLECDDGNNIDGDGCSAVCKIEPNYECRGGTNETRTVCSYAAPLQFSLQTTVKDPKSNKLTFTLDVFPPLDSLSGLSNLRNLISTDMPNSGITVSYKNGTLVLEMNYTETVQGKTFSVSLSPPGNTSSLFALQPSQVQFTVQPTNNEAAVFYDEETYKAKNSTDASMQAVQGLALGSVGIGTIITKTLSLQLISVLQTAYLGLSTVNNVNPIESSMYYLRYMNGYNQFFANLNISFFNRSAASRRLLQSVSESQMNARLISLGYESPHLIVNFNYMYGAIVVIVLLFLIVYAVGKCTKKDKVVKVAVFFLKDVAFTLLFFCVNNMGFSLGLQCRYLLIGQTWDAPLYVSWIFAMLSLVLFIVYLVFYIKSSIDDFGDFHSKFREDKLSQCHYPVLLVGRYILSFASGFFNEHPQLCYGIVAFEVLSLIYLFIRLPYKETYFNVIAIINEFVVLFVLAINMLYRNFVPTTESGKWYGEYVIIPAWIQLALMGVSVLANYIGMMIYAYQKCCVKKGTVHPAEKILDKEEVSEKQIDVSEAQSQRKLQGSNDSFAHIRKNSDSAIIEDETAYDSKASPKRKHKPYQNAAIQMEDQYQNNDGFIQQIENIQLGVGKNRRVKRFRYKNPP